MAGGQIAASVIHADAILERIAQGERISDIAQDYDRSGPGLSVALQRNFPEAYDAALRSQAEMRLERFELGLEQASDMLSVSRARELLAHQRWKLGVVNPGKYASKQAQVNINLARDPAAMTDAELVQRLD